MDEIHELQQLFGHMFGKELESGDIKCAGCNEPFEEDFDVYFDAGAGKCYCTPCAYAVADQWIAEAEAFAEANCRITCRIPRMEDAPDFRGASTRDVSEEAHEKAMKASYRHEERHLRECLHACTNFDQLTKDLDRTSSRDRAFYDAIAARAEALN